MLEKSYDLDIFGLTFDFKMTFEQHICSVSRGASQRLGILGKSWQVFKDILLRELCFQGSVLTVLKYCSACCFAVDSLHTVDYWTVLSVVPAF